MTQIPHLTQLPHRIILGGAKHNLQISEDTGDDDEPIAVLLFTPDMRFRIEYHFHIELGIDKAMALYQWLGAFLAKHAPGR